MSEPTTTPGTGKPASAQLRTLAVRITEDLRAQLDIIAQLTGRSTTEEIRLALEHWIDKTKSDPEVLKKAEVVRAEIEREAQTRRNAIAAIFNDGGSESGDAPTRTTTRRTGKPSE
jgi:predicted transcriptional regulator